MRFDAVRNGESVFIDANIFIYNSEDSLLNVKRVGCLEFYQTGQLRLLPRSLYSSVPQIFSFDTIENTG